MKHVIIVNCLFGTTLSEPLHTYVVCSYIVLTVVDSSLPLLSQLRDFQCTTIFIYSPTASSLSLFYFLFVPTY